MAALGVVAAIVIEDVLPHFDLLVTADRMMQSVVKPVQKLSLLLGKFFTIPVEHPFGVIASYLCLTLQWDSRITFAILDPSSITTTATFWSSSQLFAIRLSASTSIPLLLPR
jgi:hypothetical protein